MDKQTAKRVEVVPCPKLKVISLWEPWATAMARGLKKNETRSWPTKYRGWLAIHAAKKKYKPTDYPLEFNQMVQGQGIWPHHLFDGTYGHVLSIVKLVDCELITPEFRGTVSEKEQGWGDYSAGRFAWVTCPTNRISLLDPIPLRGRQGLFDMEMPSVMEMMNV